jgi:predicted tellurium resistance membrane protein TerC
MNQPLYKRRILLFAAILMLIAFNFTGTGCRLLKRDKQATAEKKTEDADKKADAEYEKARKQHYDNQTKETKKRMKQTKKEASKNNKSKKRKTFSGTKCN